MTNQMTFVLSNEGHAHTFPLIRVLHESLTKFQKLQVVELGSLGKTLVLDNILQLSELDDAKYHESMVHPVLNSLDSPSRTLVLGGGDGCLIREILKYDDIVVDLVEIDVEVIEASKKYLSSLNLGSFNDKRCVLHVEDACQWALHCKEKYDAIFLDITDPQHDTPSEGIMSDEVMSAIFSLLKPEGIIISQSDNFDICPNQTYTWVEKFSKRFKKIEVYGIPCVSYGGSINFTAASNGPGITRKIKDGISLKWLNQRRLESLFDLYSLGE